MGAAQSVNVNATVDKGGREEIKTPPVEQTKVPSKVAPKLKKMQARLSDESAREKFITFLKTNNVRDHVSLLKDLEDVEHDESGGLMNFAGEIVDDFLTATVKTDHFDGDRDSLRKLLQGASKKSSAVLILRAYKEFITADQADGGANVTTNPEMEIRSAAPVNGENKSNDTKTGSKTPVKKEMGKKEGMAIVEKESWLQSLMMAAESLPVSVSISQAKKSIPGFPLVYVNNCFEKTTGYPKNEIIGQNCRFLQAGKAEPESIAKLTASLRDALPVKVSITNFRKDGIPFRNLLCLKPIFNEKGEYCYVIGIQFDVTQDGVSPEKLKVADELLGIFPDILKGSQNE